MKALHSIALGFGLLLATAVNAQGVAVKANIPFAFVVGGQSLPAGEYVLQPGAILTIRSSDGSRAVSSTTYACGGGNPFEKTELVFHRVGQQRYALFQIKIQGYSEGRQLPKNRAEAELALDQKPENVVITAELVNR